MKASERIYDKFKDVWTKYNEHPFILGLADGSLPVEKFKFFIVQDHLYLMQYAKVFAIGMVKARKEEDIRAFASMIPGSLDVEDGIHQTYLPKLGLTTADLAKAKSSIVTDSYTNYMISIALKEGIAEIMAAVLTCSWTYKLIGDFLEQHETAKGQEFYGEWVRQYMSEEYRVANDRMIDFFDELTDGLSEEDLVNIENIIDDCTQYEYMFWDMAWNEKMSEAM